MKRNHLAHPSISFPHLSSSSISLNWDSQRRDLTCSSAGGTEDTGCTSDGRHAKFQTWPRRSLLLGHHTVPQQAQGWGGGSASHCHDNLQRMASLCSSCISRMSLGKSITPAGTVTG